MATSTLRKQRAKIVMEVLDQLFPDPLVPLFHKDPYTLLIATLLSAQCTDIRVNQITPLLFAKADTPEKMVLLSVEQIQSIIRPCGLSSFKAKSIYQLSWDLLRDHEGKVPADLQAMERLPGVGHKTASVVMAQAFHIPAFPIDTHIHRLAARFGLSRGKNVRQTEKDLMEIFPQEKWNRLHLQLIYFGRKYCPAQRHLAEKCPICVRINL